MSEETTAELLTTEEPSVTLSGGTAYIPLAALVDGWVATVTMTVTLTLTRPTPPPVEPAAAPKRYMNDGGR